MRYRLLVGMVLLMAMLVAPVTATSLNFQNAGDQTSVITYPPESATVDDNSPYWLQTATGINNYYLVNGTVDSGYALSMCLASPYTSTYAAATLINVSADMNNFPEVRLYDSSLTQTYKHRAVAPTLGRFEVKMDGNTAKVYRDNTLLATSGVINNPSYICFGVETNVGMAVYAGVDDYVYGQTENMYVFGLPENEGSNAHAILHDTTNPANDGLVLDSDDSVIDSTNFYGTWSRGSTSLSPTYTNESVNLVYLSTGTVYSTNYTGTTALTGTVSLNINSTLIGVSAPYGLYALNIPASGTYSNPIIYRSRGATITFDHDTYTTASTAVITYDVEDAYWDPGTYNYRIDTMNVYGSIIDTQPVTTQTGTKNMAFASTDAIGVYYTVLIADPITSGSDVWMDYDYAELNAYVTFTGYVNGAETEAPTAAHINISQGSVAYDNTTSDPFDYTTNSSFYAGTATDVNITASGYRQYTYSFTPLEAKTINLNFTLVPLAPAKTGLAIGGVFRDNPYGRPFGGGTAYVDNNTHDEHYSAVGNDVGYYLLDEADGAVLTENRLYAVVGVKTGWHNSTIYNVTVVAS